MNDDLITKRTVNNDPVIVSGAIEKRKKLHPAD